MPDQYDYLFEYKMRMADLQEIAELDRLAADLQPPSVLRRWAEKRAVERGLRREARRTASRALLAR